MRVLLTVAACLLASSAAQAQYTFEYGGRTIRIDPDRGTVSIPGVFDNTGKKSKRARAGQDGARSQTRGNPQTPDTAAPVVSAPVASAPEHPAAAPSPAAGNGASAETAAIPPAPSPAPAAQAAPPPQAPQQPAPPVASVPPPPAVTTALPAAAAPSGSGQSVATAAPPPPSPPAPVQRSQPPAPVPAAVHDANSPAGVWLTEEKEGKVRIEPCGANLCGYAVDAKSNQNGEQVLIDMKPGKDQKWSGRILDPDTGATYDATIALIGTNALRVQGCAFGGMFCGGQTWARLN
jgi:Uncharacterized protein conserved in bacteria (DUF2147)